ncbi:integrase core domain-containing protein [Streptomyces sp. NPDC003038]|uniref:integrase core domain-containing protein n=1 Tax=unclassified Streptomyces TaxID=2593676 RepID=UPI0033B6B806
MTSTALQLGGLVGSLSCRTSADDAAAESFNTTLKRETLQDAMGRGTARQARLATFHGAGSYNTQRHHSRPEQRSPSPTRPSSTTPQLR